MIAAIITAAGTSSRMGRPKATLRLGSKTFLETVISGCQAAGIRRRVVVLGADMDKVLSIIDLNNEKVVQNPAPESGPIGSIRLALAALVNHPVEAVLVWHVDRPHVAVSTVTKLVGRVRRGGASIVLPAFHGARGHPVVFARTVFEELLSAPEDEGARAVVRADPQRVAIVPVDDPAVVEDIDTPEDYRRLLRQVRARDPSL